MSKKDFYETLGVSKTASDAELKKAYRKKAMKFHPDRNPGDKAAEVKFKELGEAYDALKDPQQRAAYDKFGHAAFEHGNPGAGAGAGGGFGGFGGGHHSTADFTDMFEDLFGDAFGGGRGRGQSAGARSNRGSDLRYNLTISLNDAYNGKNVKVDIPTTVSCDICNGSGAKKGTSAKTCDTCGGHGEVRVQQGFFTMTRTCHSCAGRGKVIPTPCSKCRSTGVMEKQKTISVNIPKGVDEGTRIRLTGEGEAGKNGGQSGDLYIFIQLKRHQMFHREGPHIIIDMPLNFVDATLGGHIEVPTPDGKKARLKIPEGTQSGQQFRLRGKGMPEMNTSNHGDMFVNVLVETPTKLSKRQKELLTEFKEESSDKNTPNQESFFEKAAKLWG